MRAIKVVAFAVLGAMVTLLVIGLFLRSSWNVHAEIAIKAIPQQIFPWVSHLKQWEKWSAWTSQKYPDMQRNYEGPDHGPGSILKWSGKSSGSGLLKVTAEEPDKSVRYDLSFEGMSKPSQGSVELEPAGDGTKIIWHDHGDVGWMIMARYMVPQIEKTISADYQAGLEKLKARVEKGK